MTPLNHEAQASLWTHSDKYAGKKAVVVGGTHGMGLAMVRGLLAGGAEVLLTGRNKQNVQSIQQELGDRVHAVQLDAANLQDIEAFGHVVQEKFGSVDGLFYNAGVAYVEPFEQVSEAHYAQIFDVNTKGAFFTVQRLSPLMREGGGIVFTTVTNGPATPGLSVYSGAKAAVRAFASVFAAELVTRGIRVNTVGPGFIDTPTMGLTDASEEERASARSVGDVVTPMKRHGSSEEVARAALFLVFDATFSTGIEIPVDGGMAQIGNPMM